MGSAKRYITHEEELLTPIKIIGYMNRYITHEEAVFEFEQFGEVWYELDEIDGGGATCVSESCGDTSGDVIEARKYFVLEKVNV